MVVLRTIPASRKSCIRILDEMVELDRATVVHRWEDVIELAGEGSRLTKLACIKKIKTDGSVQAQIGC